MSTPPNYTLGEKIATRVAYGTALSKIADNNDRVIALDGDTKNSTYSDRIKVVCFFILNNISFLLILFNLYLEIPREAY